MQLGKTLVDVFRRPPPIVLVFVYVLEDQKIRNTCLFILASLHV